jgi:hypothetical protein
MLAFCQFPSRIGGLHHGLPHGVNLLGALQRVVGCPRLHVEA